MTYQINYAYTCHTGKVRRNNEDNFWCCGDLLPASNNGMEEIHTGTCPREKLPTLAVFDGMGGESQGEMAAYLASSTLGQFYQDRKRQLRRNPELFLQEACQMMNTSVCDYEARNRISSMGTTMALISFGREEIHICNLGDSKIYELENGRLTQISKDHVLGSYRFGKAPLTQFLGVREEEMHLEPSVDMREYQDGKKFLLCSDGVTDMLSDDEIEKILRQDQRPDVLVAQLLERVLEKGARDNTTIILCEIWQERHLLRGLFGQIQNRKRSEGDVK